MAAPDEAADLGRDVRRRQRHVTSEVADREAIVPVVDAFGWMDVANQLAILLEHDDQRVLEHHGARRPTARCAGEKLADPLFHACHDEPYSPVAPLARIGAAHLSISRRTKSAR